MFLYKVSLLVLKALDRALSEILQTAIRQMLRATWLCVLQHNDCVSRFLDWYFRLTEPESSRNALPRNMPPDTHRHPRESHAAVLPKTIPMNKCRLHTL